MRSNRSMPSATVIPVLSYPDVAAAADWLCDVFGFTVRLRIGDHRIQLAIGDGAVVLVAAAAADENVARAHSIMVRVDDADALYERVRRNGARVGAPPETFPYGERQFTAADLAGRCWTFSESVEDKAPEDWGGAPGRL